MRTRGKYKTAWHDQALRGSDRELQQVGLTEDGSLSWHVDQDGFIEFGDLVTDQQRRTTEPHSAKVVAVSISEDNRFAWSGSEDGDLRWWDLATGNCLNRIKACEWGLKTLSISARGDFGLSVDSNDCFKWWDLASGRCLRTFSGHGHDVTALSLSSDDRWALFSGSKPELWDLSRGEWVRTFYGHGLSARCVKLSANGAFAITGSYDGTIKHWDTATGDCIRTFEGHTEQVFSVCLSGDNKFILSGSLDGTGRLWELATGDCAQIFEEPSGNLAAIALDAGSQFVLTASPNQTIDRWGLDWEWHEREPSDWDEGAREYLEIFLRRQRSYPSPVPAQRELTDEELTASLTRSSPPTWTTAEYDSLLATLERAGFGWLRPEGVQRKLEQLTAELAAGQAQAETDVSAGETAVKAGELEAALSLIRQVRSVDGYERNRRAVDLWTSLYPILPRTGLRDAWCRRTLRSHTGQVNAARFSMDGNSVLSGGDDGLVKLWQVETGECVASLAGHDEGVTAVDFDISERNAISASADGTLKLWELASGACLHTFRGHRSRVDSFVASPDGNLILSRGNDQTVRFWELATGQSLGTIECHRLVQNLSSIWYVGYLADGRFVFGGSQYGVMDNDYHRYGLWDLASGDCLLDFYIDYSMGGDEVVGLEFSADGKLAISASEDQRGSRGNQNEMLNLWELASGEHLGRAGADYAGVAPVRITPDGRFAVSGSGYGRLKVWDTAEGDCLKTLEGHTGSIGSVDLSSDGKLLVSASADETLRLWVLDWELDHRKSADWDEGADYLRMFLERQRPYEIVLPSDRDATAAEISSALTRRGKPVWSDRDLSRLLGTLAGAGFGWLRPDRVRRRLAQMVTDAELLELCLKRLS